MYRLEHTLKPGYSPTRVHRLLVVIDVRMCADAALFCFALRRLLYVGGFVI